MKRKIICMLLVVTPVLGVGAVLPPRGQAQGSKTVVVAETVDVRTLDPQENTVTNTEIVLVNIYDTLIARDGELFRSKGIDSLWNNRELDQFIDTAALTLERGRAKEVVRRAQLMYREEPAGIPLYSAPNSGGVHHSLNWTPRADQLINIFEAAWKRR